MMKNDITYFLYARKSSESEDRQMASIDDQIHEVKRVAQELGLIIADVITESKSAKAPGRKAFNKMLIRIEKGEAQGILCWKLNRLARNPVDGGKISWMLQNEIIKHIQCYGRSYLPNDNVLMMQVEFGMANQFIKDLSTDVKRGMRNKAERGWQPSRSLPIGYIHNKNRFGKVSPVEIIPDKKRFAIVKQLWKKMSSGRYTIADIIREADMLGLRNNNKRSYCVAAFHNLFRSKFYCGYFKWKDEKGNVKEYKGKHKKMITLSEYERVQRIIGLKSITTRKRTHEFSFKGSLCCGECKSPITAERKLQVRCTNCRTKFSCINKDQCRICKTKISDMDNPNFIDITYYHCTKKRGKCSQKYITEQELKRQYEFIVKDYNISKGFYELLMEELKSFTQSSSKEEQGIVCLLESQKSELENRLKGLSLMRADGELTKEAYCEMRLNTINEISQKKRRIDEIHDRSINWKEILKDHLKVAFKASKIIRRGEYESVQKLLPQLGSNQLLLDKKLYITRPKELLALRNAYHSHYYKKETFEPKNPLILKEILGELTGNSI